MKTTVLGIVSIAAAVLGAAKALLSSGTVDWGATVAAISAGWALIHAADSSATVKKTD